MRAGLDLLFDERLLANLVCVHGLLALVLLASFCARSLLLQGGDRLSRWVGLHRVEGFTEEAARSFRSMIFWCTVLAMLAALVFGAGYHLTGRDVRLDLADLYQQLTPEQMIAWGIVLGKMIAILVVVWFVRRLALRYLLQIHLGVRSWADAEDAAEESAHDDGPQHHLPHSRRKTIQGWFVWLRRTIDAAAFVIGLYLLIDQLDWTGGKRGIRFVGRLMAMVLFARLITLAFRSILHVLAIQGERHLQRESLKRYWERFTRLFHFAEHCFEGIVYVLVASRLIEVLSDIHFFEHYGKNIAECIAIFFATRVLIELLQVLLNEAFGMYREDRTLDQKGLTLVPLLQSMVQYTLYFGSGIMMLQTMGLPTTPILAGASILGLAGGLGAQSLVTDVVSGFFILFENQYLVGDIVQIGDSQGRVEAVSIRSTQIRDDLGRLHILPNGQIKNVINFSKGFVNAVVDIKAPIHMNFDALMADMQEAGRKLRQTRREVLGETSIKGLLDLTPSEMVLRAVTKVQPGTHAAMQNEYRRLLKEIFEQKTAPKAAA